MLRVETDAFDGLLDWLVPVRGPGDVSLVERGGRDSALRSAVAVIEPAGMPSLFQIEGGPHLYARVAPMERPLHGCSPLGRVVDASGQHVSWVSRDDAANVTYLPFSPDEAIHGFLYERYAEGSAATVSPRVMSAYYALKPVIPRAVQISMRRRRANRILASLEFPAWPVATDLDELLRWTLSIIASTAGDAGVRFVWFWPRQASHCLLLTHDVESDSGSDTALRIAELESRYGFSSSFNFVPFKYPVFKEILESLRSAGCEIGVHGFNHDGRLFSSRALFDERRRAISRVRDEWGASGFRSPATHRNPDWMNDLGFDYDSSFPDTDPLEPKAGGCLSMFPFFLGDTVELPITMPQDFTLYGVLGEPGIESWRVKAAALKQRHGLVCVLTHPDTGRGYAGSGEVFARYESLLAELQSNHADAWQPLPRDAARWWRARAASRRRGDVETDPTELPSEASVGLARVIGSQLVLLPSDSGVTV